MDRETINRVEVLDTGELFLGIDGQGKPMYQYVYREAAGVYWDEARHGFKSTPMKERSCSQWFEQIISVVRYIGVELSLADDVAWAGVPADEQAKIRRARAI